MIIGLGIDIIEIDRIKRACKGARFLEKVFTQREREYFSQKGNMYPTAAGTFAAKEAFSKTLGTGILGFALTDVEVQHDQNGKPQLVVYGKALEACRQKSINNFCLSISHSKQYATAVVIAERLGSG